MSTPLLSARGLAISFGGVVAASGIDLDVMDGEILAIIGPNGAGKTTFLNICTGYLRPTQGSVRFLGADITGAPPRDITRRGIARAFQIPQLFGEHTVFENLALAAAARARRRSPFRRLADIPERGEMLELLRLVGCRDIAHRIAGTLPEGARKLADIAIALALSPRLLLMDEPTAGVASSEKFAIMDMIVAALKSKGVTAAFVEHDMDMVTRYADRVAVWTSGRILRAGPPAEVLADPEVARTVTGL